MSAASTPLPSRGLLPAQVPMAATLPPHASSLILRANMAADFKFFRRSRLILAFVIVFVIITALSILPTLFGSSSFESFSTMQQIFAELRIFLLILCGGLGLFLVSFHLRDRSLKMVFTKPCSPANWLAGAMLSAAAVSFLLNALIFAVMVVLSYAWHLSVRPGLFFLAFESFVMSLVVISFMAMLASLIHPAVAVTVAIIFNGDLFYSFQQWAMESIAAGNKSLSMRVIEHIFHALYMFLPMYAPYSRHTDTVESTYRVELGQWKYLAFSLGYTLVFALFAYLIALLSLRRKRHI
jgi:hypothetical protein